MKNIYFTTFKPTTENANKASYAAGVADFGGLVYRTTSNMSVGRGATYIIDGV